MAVLRFRIFVCFCFMLSANRFSRHVWLIFTDDDSKFNTTTFLIGLVVLLTITLVIVILGVIVYKRKYK